MQFPVVLRYTPTRWREAQQNRAGNSPSKFVTLSYQNKEPDLALPSPTRSGSAGPLPQPHYAVASTTRKRYLQPLSAEAIEKPVYESLKEMLNYGMDTSRKPFSVQEAEWYVDVTNVAQRLKLLRETYKVIKSVRKKKLMGEKADFQSLFDLRLSGNNSTHAMDDDRNVQFRSEDDDDPDSSARRPPPIPNRRGRPRKKRGVDRKPPMTRSDHKRTRASLRRTESPDIPSSPAERVLSTPEFPESLPNVRHRKSERQEPPLTSQNERLATPRSPHPKSSSQESVSAISPRILEQMQILAVANSSPIPQPFSGKIPNEAVATRSLQSDSFALNKNEGRNLLELSAQPLRAATNHGFQNFRFTLLPNISSPMHIPVPFQGRSVGANVTSHSANDRFLSMNNEGAISGSGRDTNSSSTSEIPNDMYSRADHTSASRLSYGNVTDATNVDLEESGNGYLGLLQDIDKHYVGESGAPKEARRSKHNLQAGAPIGYTVQLPHIQPTQPNDPLFFSKKNNSQNYPPI